MIKLTIGDKAYKYPSENEEVTLEQWIDLQKVQPEETTFNSDVKAFSKFTGVPQKELRKMGKKELAHHMPQVIERVTSIGAHILDAEPIHELKIGRSMYYIEQDLDNAPLGQYSDCTHFMNKMESDWDFLPYMMAIYCLKKGQTHTDDMEELEKRARAMRKARAVDALIIHNFFFHTSQDYAKDFQLYMGESQATTKSKQAV